MEMIIQFPTNSGQLMMKSLVKSLATLPVQVNGKLRGTVEVEKSVPKKKFCLSERTCSKIH